MHRLVSISLLLLLPLVVEADFFYTRSMPRCGQSVCQKEDYFRYYSCNGESCEFHLQPWVFAVVSFIVLSFLLSLLCSLITCICCPNRRR